MIYICVCAGALVCGFAWANARLNVFTILLEFLLNYYFYIFTRCRKIMSITVVKNNIMFIIEHWYECL